jgi:hypothetical protein
VAVVNVSAAGAAHAQMSLRDVLAYLMVDFVEDACVRIPVQRQHVGADGVIDDTDIQRSIRHVLAALRRRVATAHGH